MTVFAFVAAALILVALAWVLVPLMRTGRGGGVDRAAANVDILRDQLAELERDLAAGTLSQTQYDQARDELQRRVLEEATPAAAGATAGKGGRWTVVVLAIAIPLAAGLLYLQLGNLDAFAPRPAAPEHALGAQEIEGLVAKLEARLRDNPDPEGYVILARSYMAMQRFPQAVAAFERAGDAIMQHPDLLADYADALAASTGGDLTGKPLALVERALSLDPNHLKSLALAGTEAFNRKDYARAIAYWERMPPLLPPDSPFAQTVAASIAEARQFGGIAAPAASAPPPAAAPEAAVGAGRVSGVVTLAPEVAAQADPNDTVFVFARAASGPRIPLAILRSQVKDLPLEFSLDDSLAMTPAMTLSKFPEVVVGARVSKTANATPQSGDLEGLSGTVKVGANGVAVVIDRVLP